jgi:uncharacterized membrane protein YccF (DUF307 family)
MSRTVVQGSSTPFLIRVLYFFLFGWWFTGVWINAAWALNATILGLPLGVWMLNRVPVVLTLRPTRQLVESYGRGERAYVRLRDLVQRSWVVRLIWFVLVGWWASFLWANAAWVVSASVIGLPLGIWMFNRLPGITTLMRT